MIPVNTPSPDTKADWSEVGNPENSGQVTKSHFNFDKDIELERS